MFQLYKKRDISALISDTISFFKIEGKTFFKNYFIINAPLLAVLVLCIYLLGGNLFSSFFQSNTNIETILGDDVVYSGFLVVLLIITSIVFSMIAYTFPILYLKNMENGLTHTPSLYINQLKKTSGRILIFGIGTFFLILPLLAICLFVSVLLMFLIIGIPLFLLLSISSISWISLSYYEYIHNKTSFFNSYGKAFEIIKSNFWTTIGNTFIVYLIVQIITSIITFIPQSYYYFKLFTSLDNGTSIENELSPLFLLVMGITMIISLVVSFVLSNIMIVNQGLVYYSGNERVKSFNAFNSIEEIGENEI